MAVGWNVYVSPRGASEGNGREWVTGAKDATEASDFVKYLDDKLPADLEAHSRWDARDPGGAVFDLSRLSEKPKEWAEEG